MEAEAAREARLRAVRTQVAGVEVSIVLPHESDESFRLLLEWAHVSGGYYQTTASPRYIAGGRLQMAIGARMQLTTARRECPGLSP